MNYYTVQIVFKYREKKEPVPRRKLAFANASFTFLLM